MVAPYYCDAKELWTSSHFVVVTSPFNLKFDFVIANYL